MSFVTIKKSHIGSDLAVLRSKLESEGIQCFMKNEYTTQIMNYLPSFEVELQVSQSDLESALIIMTEMEGN